MTIKITLEEALNKASLRLRRKIEHSVELLRSAEELALKYDSELGYWLAFSCGKDSQALFHIAQLAGVRFKAHFSPTSIDPAEVIRFCKTRYPEVEIIPCKTSIFTQAVEMGILPTMRIRWCCAVFKEGHGAGKVTLTGIRRSESAKRSKRNEVEVSGRKFSGDLDKFSEYSKKRMAKMMKHLNQDQFSDAKENEVRCINGKDKIIINPIIDWDEDDVWEFLNEVVEVPHCKLYDAPYNRKRIGCILCPMSSHKRKIQDCEEYPHVKRKWLEAISKIRGGYVVKTGILGLSTPPRTDTLSSESKSQLPFWATQYTRNETERKWIRERLERLGDLRPFVIAPKRSLAKNRFANISSIGG